MRRLRIDRALDRVCGAVIQVDLSVEDRQSHPVRRLQGIQRGSPPREAECDAQNKRGPTRNPEPPHDHSLRQTQEPGGHLKAR